MASFLFLVAGVVIGLLAGWLLRGRRAADSQSAPTPVAPTTPSTETAAEPAVEAQAVAAPLADEPAAAVAEPVVEAEPVVAATPEPEPVVAELEPVAAVVETKAEEETKPEVTPVAEPVSKVAPVTAASTPEPAASTTPEPAASTTPEPAAEPTPAAIAVADADDLTKIAGIGPKAAAALIAAGITTYRQLADTDAIALKAAVTAAGLRSAPGLATWPEKAKQLAGA